MLSAYAWATGWSRSTLRGSKGFARALALFERVRIPSPARRLQ